MTTIEKAEIEMCSLCAIAREDTTLQESLKACRSSLTGKETIALLYSPKDCQFARLGHNNGVIALLNHENEPIEASDLAQVFEARIFNENAELRWLNQSAGLGRAVFLWEESASPQAPATNTAINGYDPIETLTELECLEQDYLLWGEGWTKPDQWGEGWSRLTLARIGPLAVPIKDLHQHQSAVMKVREYLKADDYGNLSVVEERLLGVRGK